MKLKLIITKQSDPSFSNEFDFTRFPVLLGRDDSNSVVLPDPYKIISRKHAQIIDTEGILQLMDLGSANFTYLNDERLEPEEENPLNSGDKIKIGDYELSVQLVREKDKKKFIPDDDQKTMVFSSPYKEEITNIAESLMRIAEKYNSDNSPIKSDALRFSIMQTLNRVEKNDVNRTIAEFFAENFLEKEFHHVEQQTGSRRVEESRIKESFLEQPVVEHGGMLYQDYSLSSHFTGTIDILLDMFSKLIQGFLHFRQEFFGVTIFYTIPTGSLNELKEYLFNPAISTEEEKKRLNLLKDEIQKLLSHQIGLLEGYKTSVMEGSTTLLQSINPEFLEAEIDKQSKNTSGLDLGKILTGKRKSKILEAIKENYKKYISDPYHIEKKFFRPPFMKGYQKRLTGKSQNDF